MYHGKDKTFEPPTISRIRKYIYWEKHKYKERTPIYVSKINLLCYDEKKNYIYIFKNLH